MPNLATSCSKTPYHLVNRGPSPTKETEDGGRMHNMNPLRTVSYNEDKTLKHHLNI